MSRFQKRLISFFFIIFCSFFFIFAQENKLPMGYRGVDLGMNVDEVKKALTQDSMFGYRGERDVSLLPTQERILIETAGTLFLNRCWFQFYQDKLYTMILNLNPALIDFYSVFNTLKSKYGEPSSLSPEKIVWQSETVSLSLERPLSLKYSDTQVVNELIQKAKVDEAASEILQKRFLDSL